MELPQIGNQCEDTSCKQLDFLPLKCKCGKSFCSEHFNKHVETCPILQNDKEVELKKIDGLYVCSHEDCKARSIVPIICDKCGKNFCVQHRHVLECYSKTPEEIALEKERYNSPVRRFNEAKAAVDSQVDLKLESAKKKAKTSDMANKIQLMRIKGKATGLKSVPPVDRIYFNVEHSSKAVPTPVFVSKTWTIGRCIDAIAQECKVQNNNNKANALQLRLFKKTGDIISECVGDVIGSLLEKHLLVDGESLLLQHVKA